MARVQELQPTVLYDLGRGRVHVAREEGHRLHRVQLAQDRGRARQVVRPVADPARQLAQDPDHLAALLVLQGDDVVVQLDRGQRLHEQAGPRAGRAVDDPGELAAMLRLQEQHVAVVAGGDELVLKHAVGVLPAQEALHHARELRLQAQEAAAHLQEPRRGVVRHLPRADDGLADGPGHRAQVADAGGQVAEPWGPLRRPDPACDLEPAFDEGSDVHEGPRLEVRAGDPGRGQGLGQVGQIMVGLAAEASEKRPPLRRDRQGLADTAGFGQRLERLDAGLPLRRPGLVKEQRLNFVELQNP